VEVGVDQVAARDAFILLDALVRTVPIAFGGPPEALDGEIGGRVRGGIGEGRAE
jgi:hypothetical protein